MKNEMLFNSNEKRLLLDEISSGRLSHAYLIEGDEGSGKTYFANLAARAVLCTGKDKPCGVCSSCVKAAAESHPDLFYFAPDKKASLGVDTVRDIKRSVYFMPNEGERKVYIIDDAHKLTVQAQNALLKFLEEPPESTVFFIVCEKKESMLPTVVSRTRLVSLSPSPRAAIEDFLRASAKGIDEAQLRSAVAMSEGSPGRALRLLRRDFDKQRRLCLDFVPLLFSDSQADAMGFLLAMKKNREEVKEFFALLLAAVTDVQNARLGVSSTRLLDIDEARSYAAAVTDRRIAYLQDIIIDAAVRADENANINLLLTAFGSSL